MRSILLSILIIFANPVSAEWGAIGDLNTSKDKDHFFLYLIAVGHGFLWANTELTIRKQPNLYCPPEELSLEFANYLDILEKELKRNPQSYTPDMPDALPLLNGLKETFPCK